MSCDKRHYVSLKSIREEAGFQFNEDNDDLSGVINGSNKVFTTQHRPLVDRDGDDKFTFKDINVFIDGTPVEIDDVDPESGIVTLSEAPPDDDATSVTAYYHHSQLSDEYISQKRREAISVVHRALKSNGISTPLDPDSPIFADYYATVQMIVQIFGGGLCLIRDYGSNSDTEETSKDGYKKLSTARSELSRLIDEMINDPQVPSNGASHMGGIAVVINDSNVFGQDTSDCQSSRDKFYRPRPC